MRAALSGWLFAAALVLLGLPGGALYLWLHPEPVPTPPEPRYEVPKTITYGFTLRNRTSHLLTGAEFWTQAPVRQTATQRCCERLEASVPFATETDAAGNQVLHARLAPIPPYAVRVIRVTAELRMATAPNPKFPPFGAQNRVLSD
jgi:hypothetical protein